MSTGQGVVAVFCGCEGNRRSDVAPAMRKDSVVLRGLPVAMSLTYKQSFIENGGVPLRVYGLDLNVPFMVVHSIFKR